MSINQLIASGGTPVRLTSPFELADGMNQINRNKLLNAAGQRALQKDVDLQGIRQNSVNQQGQVDRQALQKNLNTAGYGEEADASQLEQQKQVINKLETNIKFMEYAQQGVQQVLANPQAYPQVYQELNAIHKELNGPDAHPLSIPEPNDPDFLPKLQKAYDMSLQAKGRLSSALSQYQAISAEGGYRVFNKATGEFTTPEGDRVLAPNASPELAGQMEQQREFRKGVKVTGPQGEEYYSPQGYINSDFGNPIVNTVNGIAAVESGGTQDPSRASNPNSTAFGATQVIQGTGANAGFGMPEYPRNGSAEQQKAWSAALYQHYLREFGGNEDKAIQAWHDGFNAVKQGRPDQTGYVDKVRSNIVKGPTLQQKAAIENEKAVGQTQLKKERSFAAMDQLLNGKYDGEPIDDIINKATGSGIGSAYDKAGNYLGHSTEGNKYAEKLKTLQGWLVSNVPRMEGPQSDFDVKNYQQMAGAIGDDTKTPDQKRAAFNTIKEIIGRYSTPGQQAQQPGQQPTKQPTISNW